MLVGYSVGKRLRGPNFERCESGESFFDGHWTNYGPLIAADASSGSKLADAVGTCIGKCKWTPPGDSREHAAHCCGKLRATAANRAQPPKHVGPAGGQGQAFL